MSNSSLAGKVAVVTGASRGIGAAIARRLAADGAKVVVNYSKSAPAADQVVAEITAAGGEAIALQADVSDRAQVARMFADTKTAYGRLDILVNNAGITETFSDYMDDAARARMISRTPLGRIGRPEDVAGAVAFLASDDASFVTGQSIAVSGGAAL